MEPGEELEGGLLVRSWPRRGLVLRNRALSDSIVLVTGMTVEALAAPTAGRSRPGGLSGTAQVTAVDGRSRRRPLGCGRSYSPMGQ
jgi:hypothetical protein